MSNTEYHWSRIEAWLCAHLPEVVADLNPPASEAALDHAQTELGVTLPDDFRALYRLHDGQRQGARGAFFGQWFMSLERLLRRYADWKAIVIHEPAFALSADQLMTSTPPGAIQLRHADAAWIPFTEDGLSGHFALDFHPAERGQAGQVIVFGRYVRNKVVVAPDLPSFLSWVAGELEAGQGRIYEAEGLQLFSHAEMMTTNFEDELRMLLYGV